MSTNNANLTPMEQLIAFVEWERKANPNKKHIAEWALEEIYRLVDRLPITIGTGKADP
jgi:hypothetical protein